MELLESKTMFKNMKNFENFRNVWKTGVQESENKETKWEKKWSNNPEKFLPQELKYQGLRRQLGW